jgi:hypothetical protein
VVVAVVGGGLWTATHGIAHVGWTDVAGVWRQVAPEQLVLPTLIWLGGLATVWLGRRMIHPAEERVRARSAEVAESAW